MDHDVELVDLPPQPAAVVRGHVAHDGIAQFVGSAFGEAIAAIAAQHLQAVGPPFGRYRAAGDGGWEIEAGFPTSAPVSAEGRVEPAELPGGRAARTLHVGSYDGLGAAYAAVTEWLDAHGRRATALPWECYLDGPEVPEPRTEVYFPCG